MRGLGGEITGEPPTGFGGRSAVVRWAVRFSILSLLLIALSCASAGAQVSALDSDHDGISDAEEQALLDQFLPRFMISTDDCSAVPAEFTPFLERPLVAAENGVIYGQAFPRPGRPGEMELHYYDLWRKDCGQSGHDLDAEHVSVLVARDDSGKWKARYWYAAAHEDTLCDASQIARAQTLGAEVRGPEVWVSAGKHAAFLSEAMCNGGCGADTCGADRRLTDARVVNLGEPSVPMNGATWASSPVWPLMGKMRRTDFDEAHTARLESRPADEIVWANPGKRPAQAAIAGGDAALGGAATGFRATGSALDVADTSTSGALDTAQRKSGNALAKSYRDVKKALKKATGTK